MIETLVPMTVGRRGGTPGTRGHRFTFEPIRVADVELSAPLPALESESRSGRRYRRALILARLHGSPLGLVALFLDDDGLSPSDHGRCIWEALGPEINEHLADDGLEPANGLPAKGLSTSDPFCLDDRNRALATAPFATVIVPTHDRSESLGMCLDSLLNLEYPTFEIIVVDNNPSSSRTKALVEQRYANYSNPEVRYTRADGPVSTARNRGLAEAQGTVVAFTDDDAVVDRFWLLELARSFDNDRVAAVTGMILPAELETPAQFWLEQFGGFSKGFRERSFDLHENRPETPLFPYAAGMFGSGANMSFRTDVLRLLEGFDDATGPGTFSRGGEDLAAFFDVISTGHTLVYQPGAVVFHRHHSDYESLRQQAFSYGVGLTAFLTKTLVGRPAWIPSFVRRLPHGAVYLFSSTSAKNMNKRADYPVELTWLERKGMLWGPVAYLLSVLASRSHHHSLPTTNRALPKTNAEADG